MKKNYIYVVAPLIGLAVFSGLYWNYSSTAEDHIAKAKKEAHDKAQAKLDLEAAGRLKAATDAKAAQDKQKADKAAREAKEAEDADRRERANQARQKAQRDAIKLADQVKRLNKDIEDEKKEIAAIEEDKKHSVAEQVFLKEYVAKAEENDRNLVAVLDKIDVADKKWDEAVREAARAAAAAQKK